MRNNKGFTFLELIVVMSLVALALGVTMPVLSGTLESVRLKSDAQKMASLLRMARQEAITTGQPITVVFYPNNAKYKVNGKSSNYLQSGISFLGTTTFTMKVGGLPACSFSPSGAPSSGGTVTLQNGDNRTYVIVNPVAGRVRVSDTPPEDW